MSFIYSCIGDNSPENREHLEKIGYDKFGAIKGKKYLVTDLGCYSGSMVKSGYPVIDCCNNPALFQAVTAMRDDSDYMQWFTDGIDWWLCCFRDNFSDYHKINNKPAKNYHKATLEELINHFNSK